MFSTPIRNVSRIAAGLCAGAFLTLSLQGQDQRPSTASLSEQKRAILSRGPAGKAARPLVQPRQKGPHLDAGDSYATGGAGQRVLHRLAGAVAVRVTDPSQERVILREITAPGKPLARYTIEATARASLHVLRAPPGEREWREAERLQETIESARQIPGIGAANPVFVDPQHGGWLLVDEDLIVRLRPEVDPQGYFGTDWPQARPVRGTSDQFVLNLPGKTAEDVLAEVNRRAADPRVLWAEPDFLQEVRKQTNDPLFPRQLNLRNTGQNAALNGADLKAQDAWTMTAGSQNVVIAIVDDGVQWNHPDLQGNIFTNPNESPGNGVDEDQNGYADDLHGWDFAQNDANTNPEAEQDYHGTGVAGVAAAAGQNSTGVAGLAYRCQIMPIKVFAGDFFVSSSTMAEAVYYAAGRTKNGLGTWRGADVISISLTFNQTLGLDDAFTWATTSGRGGKGCPVFAATGNHASAWWPTRVRIPVSWILNFLPGNAYRFGFEYRKDGSYSSGEDLMKIDTVALLDGDGFTHLSSPIGPGGRQDFEGTFPPSGWVLDADLLAEDWSRTTSGAHRGAGGSWSAVSGYLLDFEWTELRTPLLTLSGDEWLSFSLYMSSEPGYDGLYIWVYDSDYNIVDTFTGPDGYPLLSGVDTVTTGVGYPASHFSVMGVGAATDHDRRADYSQYGTGLDFLAPSSGGWNDVTTTDRTGLDGLADGDYVLDFGGTSSACPLAAAVGALALSVHPTQTAAEVRSVLRATCDKVGGVTYNGQGWNAEYGYGRLNAFETVKQAIDPDHVQIVSVENVGSNLQLGFTTLDSLQYRLEHTDTLPANPTPGSPWAVVSGAAQVQGTGGVVQVTVSRGALHRFYRVRTLP